MKQVLELPIDAATITWDGVGGIFKSMFEILKNTAKSKMKSVGY